jgi:hypothetical protein
MNIGSLHDDPQRTTPMGMARYAVEFLEAGVELDDLIGTKEGHEIIAPIPVLYLVGHAIELALKAFLLSRGRSLKTLRRDFGHELEELWDDASSFGFAGTVGLTEGELSAVRIIDGLYSTKQLEYIVTGAKTFPVHGPLESAAIKIVRAAALAVGYPVNRLPSML